jgi:hypothetical protein
MRWHPCPLTAPAECGKRLLESIQLCCGRGGKISRRPMLRRCPMLLRRPMLRRCPALLRCLTLLRCPMLLRGPTLLRTPALQLRGQSAHKRDVHRRQLRLQHRSRMCSHSHAAHGAAAARSWQPGAITAQHSCGCGPSGRSAHLRGALQFARCRCAARSSAPCPRAGAHATRLHAWRILGAQA